MFDLEEIVGRINTQQQNFAIFIRHAEKDLSQNTLNDSDLNITEEGAQRSALLGSFLKNEFQQLGAIKSSPVKRCTQTAKIIATAYNYPVNNIELLTELGNPGVFVCDDQAAAETFKQHSIYEVVQNQLNNKPMPGIRDSISGTRLLLNKVLSDIIYSQYPIIYITHDVILMTFIGTFIKGYIEINQSNWISYLNGFCLSYNENYLTVYLVNQHYSVFKKDFYL